MVEDSEIDQVTTTGPTPKQVSEIIGILEFKDLRVWGGCEERVMMRTDLRKVWLSSSPRFKSLITAEGPSVVPTPLVPFEVWRLSISISIGMHCWDILNCDLEMAVGTEMMKGFSTGLVYRLTIFWASGTKIPNQANTWGDMWNRYPSQAHVKPPQTERSWETSTYRGDVWNLYPLQYRFHPNFTPKLTSVLFFFFLVLLVNNVNSCVVTWLPILE